MQHKTQTKTNTDKNKTHGNIDAIPVGSVSSGCQLLQPQHAVEVGGGCVGCTEKKPVRHLQPARKKEEKTSNQKLATCNLQPATTQNTIKTHKCACAQAQQNNPHHITNTTTIIAILFDTCQLHEMMSSASDNVISSLDCCQGRQMSAVLNMLCLVKSSKQTVSERAKHKEKQDGKQSIKQSKQTHLRGLGSVV